MRSRSKSCKTTSKHRQIAEKIAVSQRESLVNAKEKAQIKLEKQLEELRDGNTRSEETGYKKGYADGVADGLRKAGDLAAEDRRMAFQIAGLAAARGNDAPEATKQIVENLVKALPSGNPESK